VVPVPGGRAVLKVESLDVAYGEIRALKGVELEVGRGEIVTILGNNGAGKTTTLKTISGLLHPTRGTITLETEPLVGVPPHAIVSRGVAHVPEGRRIFNRLTVRENLTMGAYLRSDAGIAADLVVTTVPRPEVAALAFVPGDGDRVGWRGLNTAEELAVALGARWALPVQRLLVRARRVRPQRGLSKAERRANIRAAFRAARASPATVGLVDDVYTTGATVSAAARELKVAGARCVHVVTFARSVR